MAVSRKCLKASADARKAGAPKCGYRSLLVEGEKAARAGKTLADCPYASDSEEALSWSEGFEDIRAFSWRARSNGLRRSRIRATARAVALTPASAAGNFTPFGRRQRVSRQYALRKPHVVYAQATVGGLIFSSKTGARDAYARSQKAVTFDDIRQLAAHAKILDLFRLAGTPQAALCVSDDRRRLWWLGLWLVDNEGRLLMSDFLLSLSITFAGTFYIVGWLIW
jgi:hypothetical protein